MADSIQLDELPGALSGTLIVGDGRTWTATEGTGNTWPASTRLRIVNAAGVEQVLTPEIATTLATWTVTVAEVAALRGTKINGSLEARITTGTGDALRPWASGRISIVSAYVGSAAAQSLGTVTLGPSGAAVASAAIVDGSMVFTLENGVVLDPVTMPLTATLAEDGISPGLYYIGAGATYALTPDGDLYDMTPITATLGVI